jgi:hypothetical protein
MKLQSERSPSDKQLRAEIRRILALLERIRRTRHQARLLIASEEARESRRKTACRSGGARPLLKFHPRLAAPRLRRPGA